MFLGYDVRDQPDQPRQRRTSRRRSSNNINNNGIDFLPSTRATKTSGKRNTIDRAFNRGYTHMVLRNSDEELRDTATTVRRNTENHVTRPILGPKKQSNDLKSRKVKLNPTKAGHDSVARLVNQRRGDPMKRLIKRTKLVAFEKGLKSFEKVGLKNVFLESLALLTSNPEFMQATLATEQEHNVRVGKQKEELHEFNSALGPDRNLGVLELERSVKCWGKDATVGEAARAFFVYKAKLGFVDTNQFNESRRGSLLQWRPEIVSSYRRRLSSLNLVEPQEFASETEIIPNKEKLDNIELESQGPSQSVSELDERSRMKFQGIEPDNMSEFKDYDQSSEFASTSIQRVWRGSVARDDVHKKRKHAQAKQLELERVLATRPPRRRCSSEPGIELQQSRPDRKSLNINAAEEDNSARARVLRIQRANQIGREDIFNVGARPTSDFTMPAFDVQEDTLLATDSQHVDLASTDNYMRELIDCGRDQFSEGVVSQRSSQSGVAAANEGVETVTMDSNRDCRGDVKAGAQNSVGSFKISADELKSPGVSNISSSDIIVGDQEAKQLMESDTSCRAYVESSGLNNEQTAEGLNDEDSGMVWRHDQGLLMEGSADVEHDSEHSESSNASNESKRFNELFDEVAGRVLQGSHEKVNQQDSTLQRSQDNGSQQDSILQALHENNGQHDSILQGLQDSISQQGREEKMETQGDMNQVVTNHDDSEDEGEGVAMLDVQGSSSSSAGMVGVSENDLAEEASGSASSGQDLNDMFRDLE